MALLIILEGVVWAAPQSNDAFANATVLTGSSLTVPGSNVNATKENNEPAIRFDTGGSNSGGKSVWWRWTAPQSGTVRITTIGSTTTNSGSLDTILGVYTGTSFSSLTWITGNDDSGGNQTSLVTFNATSNKQYQIVVDGHGGVSGNIVLNLHLSNSPPSLLLTSPTNQAQYWAPAFVPVVAYSSDFLTTNSVDGVTNVSLYQGASRMARLIPSPLQRTVFSGGISNLAAGSYTLSAVSFSSSGKTATSAPVVVTVASSGNNAPMINLTSPASGSTLTTQDVIPITANASDPDGVVAKVDFYANSSLLGTVTASPLAWSWSGMSTGNYQLRAVATDDRGLSTTSPTVSVTIVKGTNSNRLASGPFLQICSPTSIVVRWRTASTGDSRVRYGTNATFLDSTADDSTATTEHHVLLSNLRSNTRYYYSVGSSGQTFSLGTNYFFRTAPTSAVPTRIWVLGDTRSGGDTNQQHVRDAYYQFAGTRPTDMILMMGDNAGLNGTDTDFQTNLLKFYGSVLRQSPIYPCIGNHDSYTSNALPQLYIFDLPTNGQAGGIASGTERYFSYDYANIHFVVLDTVTSDITTNGPQYAWLKRDLAANTNDWLIAFFHYPPYSKGNHDSDTESGMIAIRQRFIPLLEANGVDLVLGGHSHVYERSFFLDGHYGPSSSLLPSMLLNSGNGRMDGDGPYVKPALGPHPHQGAVYTVMGSSGLLSCGPLDHPAMYRSECNLGSMIIDLEGNRLDATFLRETGVIDDYFTIIKGSNLRITATRTQNGRLSLSWSTIPGESYAVYRKANLTAPWGQVITIKATGTTATWSDPSPLSGCAFYRVQQLP